MPISPNVVPDVIFCTAHIHAFATAHVEDRCTENLANGATHRPVGKRATDPSGGTPSNINVIYTSLKSTFSAQPFRRWQCGSIFIRLAVV